MGHKKIQQRAAGLFWCPQPPANIVDALARLNLAEVEYQLYPQLDPRVQNLPAAEKNRLALLLCTSLLYETERHTWESDICSFRRRAIRLILELNEEDYLNQAKFEGLKETLENDLQEYIGDDLSDNSDDEDQNKITSLKFQTISALHTPGFWQRTKRTTPNREGLIDKLRRLRTDIESGRVVLSDTIMEKLREIEKLMTRSPKERATLPYDAFNARPSAMQQQAIESINDILRQSRSQAELSAENTRRIQELAQDAQLYVPQFRGINYMVDRWNAPSRRYHREMNEIGLPQYAEMILRALIPNLYTALSAENDYTIRDDLQARLALSATQLKAFLLMLRTEHYCIDFTDVSRNNPYYFNNILEWLQHHYSGGIIEFLQRLHQMRQNSIFWRDNLPNAHNPFMSTGGTPYHALKYGFGDKTYYKKSTQPRWRKNGKLEYSHVGKMYMSLHRVEQLLLAESPNNVPHMQREARVALERDIAPEKEISFLSFINGDNIIYQFVAKFPDFISADHAAIDEIKYGLNEELYGLFRFFILRFAPKMPVRQAVERLLTAWLCSYYEQVLLSIAMQTVRSCNGTLVYWGQDGLLTTTPDVAPLTKGEVHYSMREQLHVHREMRRNIGAILSPQLIPHIQNNVRRATPAQMQQTITALSPQAIVNSVQRKQTSDYSRLTPQRVNQEKNQITAWTWPLFYSPQSKQPPSYRKMSGITAKKQLAPLLQNAVQLPQGLILGQAVANGNCLFDAAAQLINDGRDANAMRQLTVNYMRNHPEQFVAFFEGNALGLNARIIQMENTLVHADNHEVQALALALQRQIIVISNGLATAPMGNAEHPVLFLHHEFEDFAAEQLGQLGHYQPFRLAPGADVNAIREQVLNQAAIPRAGGAQELLGKVLKK